MKRIGQITYELSEEEYNKAVEAIKEIVYYFNNGDYRDDAERGIEVLKEIFEGDGY